MRGIFKISPEEDAANFAALNLKARAIISAGAFGEQTAVLADKLRVRSAVLAGSILAATLTLAMPAGATEASATATKHAAPDKICLQKTSYKTEGGAVPRYEYEVSQNYDAKTHRLEKIYKKSGEEGVSVSKSFSKFDESGEREIENIEYDWDADANKFRETAISKQEIAKDGSKIYFSLQKDGKPYEGEKAVEKREGYEEKLAALAARLADMAALA